MGHDFIDYEDRHLHLNDFDIWLLHYFCTREALASQPVDLGTDGPTLEALRRFLEKWNWAGPGVWIGTNLSDFVQKQPENREVLLILLQRVRCYLQTVGEVIPLEYLNENLNMPMVGFPTPQPTQRLFQVVESVRNLIAG